MSKARWQVTFNGPAASTSLFMRGSSMSPSAVRQPITTPATLMSRSAATSSIIDSNSAAE